MRIIGKIALSLSALMFCASCHDDDDVEIHDPDKAEVVSVDRFSSAAGVLQVRTTANGLPGPNVPVNFDQGVFITKGLGPQGQLVEYYNFDMKTTDPAPIWVLFREGKSDPVAGQLNIIDALPGEMGYNDFWQIIKVTVPAGYKANEVASRADIVKRKYKEEPTSMLVNCPVVPAGSTASKRLNGESSALTRGWYKEKVVMYFNFSEKMLATNSGMVPLSPIYVSFMVNPSSDPNSGPGSGFKTEEAGSLQTHNVTSTLPSDNSYSPLWVVNAFDNAAFNSVSNLITAQSATSVGKDLTTVNCPIVKIN